MSDFMIRFLICNILFLRHHQYPFAYETYFKKLSVKPDAV